MINPEKVDVGGLRASAWFLKRGVLLTKWTGVLSVRNIFQAMESIREAMPGRHLIEVADVRSALWVMSPQDLVDAAARGEMVRSPVALVVNEAQRSVTAEAAHQACAGGYVMRPFTSDLQALVWATARLPLLRATDRADLQVAQAQPRRASSP